MQPPACLLACGSLGHPFPQSLIKHKVTRWVTERGMRDGSVGER